MAAKFSNLERTAHSDQMRNSFLPKQMVFLLVKKFQWTQIASQTSVDGMGLLVALQLGYVAQPSDSDRYGCSKSYLVAACLKMKH
jgi:hypothetical protein